MRIDRAPGCDFKFGSIGDGRLRHEALVDLFGQYVFWLRNWTNRMTRKLVESREARERLGAIQRRPYEAISRQPNEEREEALLLGASTLDSFIQLLLGVLGHVGFDFQLGDKHTLRFRLIMEVVDRESGDIVHEEIVNRDGSKHFPNYWGRWLNQPWSRRNAD